MLRFALIALLLGACTASAPRGGGDILMLGDSVMAWNGGRNQSIGDALARELERDVTNKAVVGARLQNESMIASAVGFDIQQQFPGGRWNWIVLDGGANDLGFGDCGCGDCRAHVDRLISVDGTNGVIPAFLSKLKQSGAQVVWLGYYWSPGDAFQGCRDDLVEMEKRIARYVARDPALHFVDGETVIQRGDSSHFAPDRTHPSPKGSSLLAKLIAGVIQRSQ